MKTIQYKYCNIYIALYEYQLCAVIYLGFKTESI